MKDCIKWTALDIINALNKLDRICTERTDCDLLVHEPLPLVKNFDLPLHQTNQNGHIIASDLALHYVIDWLIG